MWTEIELEGWKIEMHRDVVMLEKNITDKEKVSENCYIKIIFHKVSPLELRLEDVEYKTFRHPTFKLEEVPKLLDLLEDVASYLLYKKQK